MFFRIILLRRFSILNVLEPTNNEILKKKSFYIQFDSFIQQNAIL